MSLLIATDGSAEWYDIGSFVASVISVAVTIIIAVVTLWVTYRIAVPKRRLVFITDSREMVMDAPDVDPPLSLVAGGTEVASPPRGDDRRGQ